MNQSITSGIKWNGISQFITQGSVIGGSIILGRILSPDDFGTVAMVTIISSFATMFLDMGFSQALIQKKKISDQELCSVFWLNNLIALVFFILFFISAPLISDFYDKPILAKLTRIISVNFLLSAIPQIPRIILTRELNFKKLGIINIITIPSSYIIGIILAYYDFGIWSLITQVITANLLLGTLLWVAISWRPFFHFLRADISGILNYSFNTFLNQVLEYWAQNISSILIGKHLGAADMGTYNRSRVFILLPINNLSLVINRTIFP